MWSLSSLSKKVRILYHFFFFNIYISYSFLKCICFLFLGAWVAANALHATNNFQIIPDFSLKDSMDQTVLGLALWTGTPLGALLKWF